MLDGAQSLSQPRVGLVFGFLKFASKQFQLIEQP